MERSLPVDVLLAYELPLQEVSTAGDSRCVMSLYSTRNLATVELSRPNVKRVWQGFVSRPTWQYVNDMLSSALLEEQSQRRYTVGAVDTARTPSVTWRRQGHIVSVFVSEASGEVRRLTDALEAIIGAIAPVVFGGRVVPAQPIVKVDYSYEMKAPPARKPVAALTEEERAEAENARQAAEEVARLGVTQRRCLRCGGELVVRDMESAYEVLCSVEGRVVARARGI